MNRNDKFLKSISQLSPETKKEVSLILLRAYCELTKVDFLLIEMDFPGIFPMIDQKDSPSSVILKLRKMFKTNNHDS